MEENNFEDNIFGEKENFIEGINPDKVKNFLSKLRNNKDLSKILELIKNKIIYSDIIPHVLNMEILDKNRLIFILIELYFQSNENENTIKELLKLLISKIEIKREYIIFLCQQIRILEEKKEINEKFIIKCIEIFEKFFYQLNDNFNSFEILPKKENKKCDYFYFSKLKYGFSFEKINNVYLENSYFYIKKNQIRFFSD